MGRLIDEVFNPSCCDGGAASNDNSCASCGCDKGANWVCQRHRIEQEAIDKMKELRDATTN